MKKNEPIKERMTAAQRKDQIVKVATALFAANGFSGTTTRQIADAAGISEAVIYRHFANKDALYDAIINARCLDTQGNSRLLVKLKGMEGKAFFKEIATFLINEHKHDDSFLRLLLFSALEGHGLSEKFLNTKSIELFEHIQGQIKGLIKNNVFRDVDPLIVSRAFIGMVIHYSISQEIFGQKRHFKRSDSEVVDAFVDIFFDGILKR